MQAKLKIKRLVLGEQNANCYLLWSLPSGEGYVIDPADSGELITQSVLDEQITLRGIILTHGHFDHLLGLLELQLNLPVPVYLHPADQFLLERAQTTAAHFLGHAVDPVPTQTEPLAHEQRLPLGQHHLRVLHTPGHTPGSVCLLLEPKTSQLWYEQEIIANTSIIFTGDTLFAYGTEPLTHRYSRPLDLAASLKTLGSLEKETIILPGHGDHAWLDEALANR